MKTIILFLFLTSIVFSQIEIDSAKVSYSNTQNQYTFTASASFQANPNFQDGDYSAGFFVSTDREPTAFHPAGSFVWNNPQKRLDWTMTLTNLPNDRYFYKAVITPNSTVIGFTSDGINGNIEDNFQSPFITGQLPKNKNVDSAEVVTYTISAEGLNLQYEWQVDNPQRDSTYNPVFDTLGVQIDSTLDIKYTYDGAFDAIPGHAGDSYTFTALEPLNRNKYRVKIFNNIGIVFSQISTLRVR